MKKHLNTLILSSLTLLITGCQQQVLEQSDTQLQVKSSSIIIGGQDDRRPMTNFDSSVVSIMAESGSTVCSGTVIGPKHIITAAHCFYDQEDNQYKTDRFIVPAYNHAQGAKPIQRFFIENLYIANEYISETKGLERIPTTAFMHDLAIVEIKDTTGNIPFAEQTRSVPMEAFDKDYHLGGKDVTLKAFHGDLATSTPYIESNCSFDIVFRSGLIGHSCDNFKGSSGSSLQFNQSVVAINTAEQETRYNIGTPLTFSRIESIEAIFQNSPQPLFEKVAVDQTPFVGLDVMNNCDEEILIAFHFQNTAGQWVFMGHYRLTPGNLFISPVAAKSANIYYQAQTQDRSFTWEGDKPVENRNGQTFQMKHLTAETRYYDHRLNISCD